MRKSSLTLALALLAILLGTAGAVRYDDLYVSDSAEINHMILNKTALFEGPATGVIMNWSKTDTLTAGEVVMLTQTPLMVVDTAIVGNATTTMTITDSIKFSVCIEQ